MRTTTKKLLAIALVGVMVASAGCAGWGTDGPADSDESENDNNASDDLEDAQNDTDTSDDGGDSDSDTDSNSSSDSSDTSSDSSDSSDTTDSDGDGDDSSSEDDSATGSSDPEPQGSDGGDDGSTGDDSTTDSDSDGDADDSKDTTDSKDSKDTDSDTDPKDDSDSDDKKNGDTDDGSDGDDGTDGDDGDDGDDDTNGDDTNGDDKDTDEPETHELKVTVVNHNDEPLENASVSVVAADSGDEVASGTTDSDGIATFDLESGEYDIIADHEDALGDGANRVTVEESDTEASVKLDTSDGLATGVVKVVDQNGDPVEGEPVTLWPPGAVDEESTETRETDENGEVRIELSAGDPSDAVMFDVIVRGEEKHLGIMADAHTGVQEVEFTVDTSENGEPETHELEVSVTDPNEDPVEGASVSIVTYDAGEDVASGTTNSDGVATFDVPNGDYEAVVTTEDDDLLQPSDQRLVTVDGEDATLNVQMQGSGDNGNGNGNGEETYTLTVIADSAVTLESTAEDGMSETKEPTDGVVTFEVPEGGYTLSADGYHWADVPLVEEDTEIELQSTDGATMDITVVDSETGNGVGGAEISGECDLWYSGGDSYVETTSASEGDGVVTVQTGVTPTSCDANVTAPGYEATQISLDAPGDDSRIVELVNSNPDVPEPNESGNETDGNATLVAA